MPANSRWDLIRVLKGYIHQVDYRCGTQSRDEKRIQKFGRSVSIK